MNITHLFNEGSNWHTDPEQQSMDATRRARLGREREPAGSGAIDARLAANNNARQQYAETGHFWLKQKDTQQHLNDQPYVGKAAANAAALELLKQQPELRGNLVITAYGPGEQQVTEGRVKELGQDLKDKAMSDNEFKAKYGKTRAEVRAAMREKQGVAEGSDNEPNLSKMSIDELKQHIEELTNSASEFFGVERSYINMDIAKAKAMLRRKLKQGVAEGSLNEGYIVKNGSKYLRGHPAGGGQMTWVADKAKATVFKSKGEISRAANMRGWSIIPAQQGVAEVKAVNGGFPFDVDHMNGSRGIGLDWADTRDLLQKPFEHYGNYKEWYRDVNRVNSELLDDNAEYTTMAGGKIISINGKEFAWWSNRNGNGSIDIRLAKKHSGQGVAEGLSKRDQQDVAAIRAAIARLESQLNHPNADKAAIQQSIAHEKKRLALYGQGVAEGSETAADIDKKIEFHKQGQAAAQYKGAMNKMHAAKIRELEAKKKQQGVAEGSYDYVKRGKELSAATKKTQADLDRRIRGKEGSYDYVKRGKELSAATKKTQADLDRRIKKLDQGVAEDSNEKTPGIALSKAYKKDFDDKKPGQDRQETALTSTYSKTGKPGGELKKKDVAEDKGMSGYNAFKREWRAKHGSDAKVPAYDSKEYTSYVYRHNDKKQGVAEGSDPGKLPSLSRTQYGLIRKLRSAIAYKGQNISSSDRVRFTDLEKQDLENLLTLAAPSDARGAAILMKATNGYSEFDPSEKPIIDKTFNELLQAPMRDPGLKGQGASYNGPGVTGNIDPDAFAQGFNRAFQQGMARQQPTQPAPAVGATPPPAPGTMANPILRPGKFMGPADVVGASPRLKEQGVAEGVGRLNVGDPVIITGNVQFQGKTGDVKEIGQDGSFVVVDLYNYGPQSFQATDVSYNDYADETGDLDEGEKVGNMDADRFDAAIARLKQLAGAGPMRTVYDPEKRVYKNVPVAQQPGDKK